MESNYDDIFEDEYSEEYPIGGTVERYDIQRDAELTEYPYEENQ